MLYDLFFYKFGLNILIWDIYPGLLMGHLKNYSLNLKCLTNISNYIGNSYFQDNPNVFAHTLENN